MLPNSAIKYDKWYIVEYRDDLEKEWDDFIFNDAVNACFLQSRKFLNYHPKERFEDCSLIIYDNKGKISAVCAGCIKNIEGKRTFLSHAGSSYGGVILCKSSLRMEKCMGILETFERHLKKLSISHVLLKQLNPLMRNCNDDLLEFCFYYRHYTEYKELNSYVDFEHYNTENVTANFSKLKRRAVRKCLDLGMHLKELTTKLELERFLEILTGNLEKYTLKPYHTVDDLIDLQMRFPDEIKYWGCEYEGEIIAVTMVFLFNKIGVIHTHYLAADRNYNNISPMTFIYYKMIDYYKDSGFNTLSWGITTEHKGIEINTNLTNTKEEYGSIHNIISVFEKDIE